MAHPKVDAKLIAELTAQLEKNDLTELEWSEGDRTIRIVRGSGITQVAAQAAPAPAPAAPIAAPATATAPAPAATSGPGPGDVTSPMVGTVYVAADPNTPPYVEVGDTVSKGQTVFIVEAMKTMNPITAHMSGTVEAVLIANGEAVEYGQPLLTIV
ncbi:MAG: acetyl-CoA carboxylase biotin carboxyl carrier protein [Alphaproteobacteria bacterium]|jgi:acetyl-CoA carboxylase biotin carboxyl carrier protein|nr:acetyl-CoA carboxylase biotin carboxyl carrier protein [Alphaproteobacteria bacterium]MBT5861270.1 acetyl-CoA carboxylase biotin carboxyl carrier protein [Alphaproteobacteria bacterium]